MLIGSQYSDEKLYGGIKHYDSLPLTSGDIHEYADTQSMKSAYIMNNIIGHGILNSPRLSLSATGIKLLDPAVLLLDGDIALIAHDSNKNIIDTTEIAAKGYSEGSVCIVGWYQHIKASNTLHKYGGVNNSTIPNTLADNSAHVQFSTRYQFIWNRVLVSSASLENSTLKITLPLVDENGNATLESATITSVSKVNNVYRAPAPSSMSYAVSDIFIIPVLRYIFNSSTENITDVKNYLPISPKGTSGFIEKDTEPTGEYNAGTVWYNPITREFKTYVSGVGFIDSTSKIGYLQYQSAYTVPLTIDTPQDIEINININELEENDILRVYYEGLTLTPDEQYTVDYVRHTITLKDFTIQKDEKITFTAIKIVEANDITNITATFTSHMAKRASDTVEAHVKLSDTLSDSNASQGVAATPKLVNDAISKVIEDTQIKDSTTDTKYRFGVENGLLYIEEV